MRKGQDGLFLTETSCGGKAAAEEEKAESGSKFCVTKKDAFLSFPPMKKGAYLKAEREDRNAPDS